MSLTPENLHANTAGLILAAKSTFYFDNLGGPIGDLNSRVGQGFFVICGAPKLFYADTLMLPMSAGGDLTDIYLWSAFLNPDSYSLGQDHLRRGITWCNDVDCATMRGRIPWEVLAGRLDLSLDDLTRCNFWGDFENPGPREQVPVQDQQELEHLFDGSVARRWQYYAEYTALKNKLAEAYAEWINSEKFLSRMKEVEDLVKEHQQISSDESATLKKELDTVKSECPSLRDDFKKSEETISSRIAQLENLVKENTEKSDSDSATLTKDMGTVKEECRSLRENNKSLQFLNKRFDCLEQRVYRCESKPPAVEPESQNETPRDAPATESDGSGEELESPKK
ncbi:uncharacterized protein J7T54_000454 [Emericellopsis cladophorae]|uniref:Uncharacterized protein n=1 Tax=Emericellopsis cladophorae TaxID=2686198 RepID=A0A9P9XXA1_9HYPO|nr:uncharacterized protein J7T54_000454 [Emericellopsis cladophorae]KAI6779356.1 hypothetical protein J7T54_000454 [Emericellopsis cladophorae]